MRLTLEEVSTIVAILDAVPNLIQAPATAIVSFSPEDVERLMYQFLMERDRLKDQQLRTEVD